MGVGGPDNLRCGSGHVHDADLRVRAASRSLILPFAGGCALSSAYRFPRPGPASFDLLELIWAIIAVHRNRTLAQDD